MGLDFELRTKCCGHTIYCGNITHNLVKMASESGIYEALWHPEEINATKAGDIISILERGLKDMKNRTDYYKQFDSENGWGTYEQFIPFIEEVLEACKKYPDAGIFVWR